MKEKIAETTGFLRSAGFDRADAGVILGTGLSAFTGQMEVELRIPYAEIPHFAESTVESHHGKLLFGRVGDQRLIAMQGRFHYYEGYDMEQITFPLRVMKELGIGLLMVSNAAGGINMDYEKGDLAVLKDHINLLPENPLRGPNNPDLGERFPDMSAVYDPDLRRQFLELAQAQNVRVQESVYASVPGPQLETPAEYRFLGMLGADLVGMSTVPEVIVARHMGLPVLAVSVVTDLCDPDNLQPLKVEDVIAVASQADGRLSSLFAQFIKQNAYV